MIVLSGAYIYVNFIAPKTSTTTTGGGGTSQGNFSGPISLTINTLRAVDDAVITSSSSPLATPAASNQLKVYHADWTFASNIPINSATTFTVNPSDNGVVYLLNDYTGVTCCFLATAKTKQANTYITATGTRDINGNGVLQPYFTLSFSNLPALGGGQTAVPVTMNVWYYGNEENFGQTGSAIKFVSTLNATGTLTTTGFADSHASGYFAWAGTALGSRATGVGYLVRMTKLELTMDTNNATQTNNGNVNLRSITLGGQVFNTCTFTLSNNEFLCNINISAVNQPTQGVDFTFTDGLSASWFGYDVWINAKLSGSGVKYVPTLKITCVLPSGSIVTESQTVSFA